MKQLSCGCAVLLGLLGGCSSAEQSEAGNPLSTNNKMTCVVDGTRLTGTGEQVGIASLGVSAKHMSLGLTLNVVENQQQVEVSTGLMTLPLEAGSYRLPEEGAEGYSLGSYKTSTAENETIREYTGANFWLFYANQEKDPETRTQINILRIEKLTAPLPNFVRLKLVGNFKFQVAYVPYVDGNLSDACTTEAITRSIKRGPRFPQYNASICGAEKKSVSGEFEVTQDFIKI